MNVVDAQQCQVDAVLDTGTRMTIIRQCLVQDFASPIVGIVELGGVTSTDEWCFVHAVTLEIHIADLSEMLIKPPRHSFYRWLRTHVISVPSLPEKHDCLIGMDILDRLKLKVGGGGFPLLFQNNRIDTMAACLHNLTRQMSMWLVKNSFTLQLLGADKCLS